MFLNMPFACEARGGSTAKQRLVSLVSSQVFAVSVGMFVLGAQIDQSCLQIVRQRQAVDTC